ncbi:SpoIIE family protein phosphatase, partial [bacterium]|nr:SpoIIE family protein phosphatase [bacterium]
MLKRLLLLLILITLSFPILGGEEEVEEDYKQKYEDLKEGMTDAIENQQYMKDAPEGLEANNYVIDDKGYLWYIYEASTGNYQIMRYNGYESEIIESVANNLFLDDEDSFNKSQKAFKQANGGFVFLTPQNIVLNDNNVISIYPLINEDRIYDVFIQNGKVIVLGENSYYVVVGAEVMTSSTKFQLSDTAPKIARVYSDNFEENISKKHDFLLTINNDILMSQTKYNYGYRFYKYNSNSNFQYMAQLTPIEQDYYVKLINESLVDSIFVMSKDEYNEIINPMVEPQFISDTKDISYLYFKYTNYFYSIDPKSNEAEKIDLSQDIKIVNIFKDKEKCEWVIYHNDEKIYISDFDAFIKQVPPLHYYEFTEQESASGGSFCLYWNENIYKFRTKGTLNNKKFTNADKRMSQNDYEDQYKLEYVRYLCRDNLTDNKKFEEFDPGFEEVNFNNIYYSDNMLINARSNSEVGRIKELKFYDFENGNKSEKKIAKEGFIRNIQVNRSKNLLILSSSDETNFIQMENPWSKVDLSIVQEAKYYIDFFENSILVVDIGSIYGPCKIYDYSEGKFTLQDSLAYNSYVGIDKVNNALILREVEDDFYKLNRYYLTTGKIDSLLAHPKERKIILGYDKLKMVLYDEDSYRVIDIAGEQARDICQGTSSKLYTLVQNKYYDDRKILENNLFIKSSKILYDLEKDEYETKDKWIAVTSTDNTNYVLYKEYQDETYIYRVSKFINGNLVKTDDDFIHYSKQEYYRSGLVTSGESYFPVLDNFFYYFASNKWNKYTGDYSFIRRYISGGGDVMELCDLNIETTENNLLFWKHHSLISIDYKSGLCFEFNDKNGLSGLSDYSARTNFNNQDLFVGGWNSFSKFNSRLFNPTLDISWLEVNGERKDLSKPLRFSSSENTIAFPVAILNYMYPEEYPMKYKLTGFDEEWKVGTYDGKITYENLNPGKYSFDIQAFPTDFSDMSWPTIEFRILPPWYRSWWAYTAYFLFISLVIYLIFKQRIKLYKKNQEVLENKVAERTQELSEKTQELTEQQEKMRESIEYASLIQRSILPQESELKLLFQEHFVIWKPRDIVGGDFYWFYDNQDKQEAYIAVIDCTGHGVPGALLSMTVNSLLNYTVKDRKITSPAQIVNLLHQEIGSLMHQRAEKSVQDGFEISLLKIDYAKQSMSFCGAGLNIILQAPDQELQIIKGDKYNVGGLKLYTNINFTEETFAYQADTKIYLYSDGIIDQPNPDLEIKRRLGYKGWIEILQSLDKLSMEEQARELNI